MSTTIKGKIKFETSQAMIPDGSLLTVKLEDTSYHGTKSTVLEIYGKDINGYAKGDTLDYKIKYQKPNCSVTTVSY